eukprot:gnl/TRDRNA2_/TRDRNA2_199344_c0_seq1.p1 gnl/TRDRNA2_/TRDRNA2_199344_c0~~gnl/TRDRNA2_/TRDRNA2_199344_c0_seq1.p1  ORF type:complete len:269 (+),score=34.36 gnl/TRDRNA2_/TRDRNA2_199344_c0_seq1:52-858(+)
MATGQHQWVNRGDPRWMPDESTERCLKCSAEFTTLLRKHHCRGCGQIFCESCSSRSIENNRVCDACATSLSAGIELQPRQVGVGTSSAADAAAALKLWKERLNALAAVLAPRLKPFMQAKRQPWDQFLVFRKPDTGVDLQAHIERNLLHFQGNYLFILLFILCVTILSSPARLVTVAFLLGAWASYVHAGGLDPNWKPKVLGLELQSAHRLAILSAGSLSLIFLVDGEALLTVVGLAALLTLGHAAFSVGSGTAAANPPGSILPTIIV